MFCLVRELGGGMCDFLQIEQPIVLHFFTNVLDLADLLLNLTNIGRQRRVFFVKRDGLLFLVFTAEKGKRKVKVVV